ncbi:MAG: SRPBCC domain-containing protein, partial [Frankia sp.]
MVANEKSTPLSRGTVTRNGDRSILRYERHLRHPVAAVWAAITEPEQLVAWLADAQLEPIEGGKVVLTWLNTDDEGNRAIASGTVRRWEPPHLAEFDIDIHGRLRFELDEEPG